MLVLKRNPLTHLGLTCLLLLLSHFTFAQQPATLKGTVVNATDNTPLEGVSVVQEGQVRGTVTNKQGAFTLKVTGSKPVIIFSYVGFQNATLSWDGKATLNVKLESNPNDLQDVVVVGYGVQKKINQTGAVQTIKFEDAVNQPVTNTGQLMYGRFAGVQLTQSSGLPGTDASSVVIRGVGTFGNSTPLIVIDNIQYATMDVFNSLSPADIESISVLKDASASSIYGARGANGVIVVTTKQGKVGTYSVVYNNYFGFQSVTVVPEYLDAVNFATLRNERDINTNGPTAPIRYSAADIQLLRDGSDRDRYANTKWSDEILKTAPIQNHFIAISGGAGKTSFRASLGYLTQGAVVQGKFKADRYNLGLNINSKITNWLTLSSVTNAFWSKFVGPSGGPNAITGETGIINQFQRSAPTVPVYYSNGEYGIVDGSYLKVNASLPITNPIQRGFLGDYVSDQINVSQRIGLKIQLHKNLSFETSGSFNISNTKTSDFSPTNQTLDWAGNIVGQTLINTLRKTSNFNYRLLAENILRFNKIFGKKHDVSVLFGQSAIYSKSEIFSGSLQGFPSNTVQEFDGGGLVNPTLSGSAQEDAVESLFGRINYVHNKKYLFEFNARRDGSSKFPSDIRYGIFPSASAGWRIKQENWFKKIKWLTELKIKGSWGITGNDNIGNYIFQQTLNGGLDYFIGTSTPVTGVSQTTFASRDIKWETVEQYDIGVDIGLFKNKLTIGADYFDRLSTDLLYNNFPLPPTLGITSLRARNSASMQNKGVEIVANYQNKSKEFSYNIGGSVTYNISNNVVSLGNGAAVTLTSESVVRAGSPFQAILGYRVLGVFQTAAEVAAAPRQFGSLLTAPGDFQYADISGPDGKPDGIVDIRDREIIGDPYPKYIYNFNSGLNWKSFSLSFIFEGVADLDRLLRTNGQTPMEGDRNNALSYWVNRWTPTNTNTNLPRLGGINNGSAITSSFYIQDVSYLRMKNIEVGYTIPESITKKLAIARIRIFMSGQNMVTFTKMKNFDPERSRNNNSDQLTPLYKTFTVGLNVKF